MAEDEESRLPRVSTVTRIKMEPLRTLPKDIQDEVDRLTEKDEMKRQNAITNRKRIPFPCECGQLCEYKHILRNMITMFNRFYIKYEELFNHYHSHFMKYVTEKMRGCSKWSQWSKQSVMARWSRWNRKTTLSKYSKWSDIRGIGKSTGEAEATKPSKAAEPAEPTEAVEESEESEETEETEESEESEEAEEADLVREIRNTNKSAQPKRKSSEKEPSGLWSDEEDSVTLGSTASDHKDQGPNWVKEVKEALKEKDSKWKQAFLDWQATARTDLEQQALLFEFLDSQRRNEETYRIVLAQLQMYENRKPFLVRWAQRLWDNIRGRRKCICLSCAHRSGANVYREALIQLQEEYWRLYMDYLALYCADFVRCQGPAYLVIDVDSVLFRTMRHRAERESRMKENFHLLMNEWEQLHYLR